MSLRIDETLESFIKRITENQEIMNIMKLPTILNKDTEEIKIKKRKAIIDKVIVKKQTILLE